MTLLPADAGTYLTNEVFLYRVVGSVPDDHRDVVKLEDCYLLDIVDVPVSQLRRDRFRVVTPAIDAVDVTPAPVAAAAVATTVEA
jgi:hypothetical protein